MFRVMIVEDEQPVLDLMLYVIGQNPHYLVLGAFTKPLEALAAMPALQPDLVFVDVEMPRMNGIEFAQKINERHEETKIIFTTAYKQYALEAFQVYAFDYILKPVTPEAIERVAQRLTKQRQPAAPVKQSPAGASIRCFGGFEVCGSDHTPIRWPTRKAEELFAYFLCHPEKELSKWQLADLLWPQMEEDRALHNLHNTIYRVKKILKEHQIVVDVLKINDGYMLDPCGFTYDALAFERHAAAEKAGKAADDQAERLCALYQGPLLERKDYAWKPALEEWHSKQYTAWMRRLIEADLSVQRWPDAERRLNAYLAFYPLHEEMNQRLMELYESWQRPDQLIAHYVRFEELYRQELGLEPPEGMRRKVQSARLREKA